jgi:thiamine pyrophosphate-dependent acetolactate synthase large subunit-like protein
LDIAFLKESQQIAHVLVAKAVIKMLEDIKMQYAFGISGGAIAFL